MGNTTKIESAEKTDQSTSFKAPMIRAVLAGHKSQTRRTFTARNSLVDGAGISQKRWDGMGFDFSRAWVDDGPSPAGNPGPYLKVPRITAQGDETVHRIYPRTQPGDKVWVREAFQPLFAEGVQDQWETNWKTGKGYAISYPATDGIHEFVDADDNLSDACKPSIHMPRWASRITLDVTAVRVESVQHITRGDCMAEGCPFPNIAHETDPIKWYSELWESINGPGSWAANPWVWVIEFKVVRS